MPVKQGKYRLENFADVFTLSTESPSGLSWNISSGKKKKGDSVGCASCDKSGKPKAWIVTYNRVIYQIHRIIWILMHGELDDNLDIDHINRNPFDNTVTNLRAKPHRQNLQNRNLQINNTTGRSGVTYIQRLRPNGKVYLAWRASCIDEFGKTIHKDFSVERYGQKVAKILANQKRTEMLLELNTTGGQQYADDYF